MAVDKKTRRKQVALACTACRKSKTACDEARPCSRCVARGCGDCCVDAPKKKRMTKQALAKSSVVAAKNKRDQTCEQHFPSLNQPTPMVPMPYHDGYSNRDFVEEFDSNNNFIGVNTSTSPLDLCFFPPPNLPSIHHQTEGRVNFTAPCPSDPLQFRTVAEPESFDPFAQGTTTKTSSSTDILGNLSLFNTPSIEAMLYSIVKDLDSPRCPKTPTCPLTAQATK